MKSADRAPSRRTPKPGLSALTAGLLASGNSRRRVARPNVQPPPPLHGMETDRAGLRGFGQEVTLGNVPVTLLESENAVKIIIGRAREFGQLPLAVVSANLDHVKHFGKGGLWAETLEAERSVEWLTLLDGAPLVHQAEVLTGTRWPRLAGSDLILPLLDAAETTGLRIGILGGTSECHQLIQDKLGNTHPQLQVAGYWAPERSALTDAAASRSLAAEIAMARIDMLVVCLGKPRQELWIAEYGALTGAKTMLCFGAVVDFLAGRVRRAPEWISGLGLEWAWRLALEPRRLGKRYLVDGPQAYLTLRRASSAVVPTASDQKTRDPAGADPTLAPGPAATPGFTPPGEHAAVAVVIVTYMSENDVPLLLEALVKETADQSIKVVVADNSPTQDTLQVVKFHPHVLALKTGGNLGYAGGINAAMKAAGTADAYLVLNPDMRVERGAVRALRERMAKSDAGVVVPLLCDDDGAVYPSLRHEPALWNAVGDALMGSRLKRRPSWLSEMDFEPESYLHAHPVEWATGAALLIRPDIVERVGDWDERYFLYSEETDFLHRVRELGAKLWFEPASRMTHRRGGSGTSPQLNALMATNRIRYIRKFRPGPYARAFRAVVVLAALLRAPIPGRWPVLAAVLRERRWTDLPQAVRYPEADMPSGTLAPRGSVIIPAHNEAAVIARTMSSLAPLAALDTVDVVVACNGCTDRTEEILSAFEGVTVLSLPAPSKTAALNAADAAASHWPRVYLDADIEISAATVCQLLSSLDSGGEDGCMLAARPASQYVTDSASPLVRAYYRARSRIPSLNGALWGGGVYGLSQAGHQRFGSFPEVTADDYFVDRLFEPGEKRVLKTEPVLVRTPRTASELLRTLHRVYRGVQEQAGESSSTFRTVSQLLQTVRGPLSAVDACVYAGFAAAGRWSQRQTAHGSWERDESSRIDGGARLAHGYPGQYVRGGKRNA